MGIPNRVPSDATILEVKNLKPGDKVRIINYNEAYNGKEVFIIKAFVDLNQHPLGWKTTPDSWAWYYNQLEPVAKYNRADLLKAKSEIAELIEITNKALRVIDRKIDYIDALKTDVYDVHEFKIYSLLKELEKLPDLPIEIRVKRLAEII